MEIASELIALVDQLLNSLLLHQAHLLLLAVDVELESVPFDKQWCPSVVLLVLDITSSL